jgi:hypothetical protein
MEVPLLFFRIYHIVVIVKAILKTTQFYLVLHADVLKGRYAGHLFQVRSYSAGGGYDYAYKLILPFPPHSCTGVMPDVHRSLRD